MAISGRKLSLFAFRTVILALFCSLIWFPTSSLHAAPVRKVGKLTVQRVVKGDYRLRAIFRSTGRAPTRVGLRFSSELGVLDYSRSAKKLNPGRSRFSVCLRRSLLTPGDYTFQARAISPIPSSWTDEMSLTLEDESDPIIIGNNGKPVPSVQGDLPPLPPLAGQSECPSNYEQDIIRVVNIERVRFGLSLFSSHPQLAWSARLQAIENAEAHVLSHDGWFDKVLASGAVHSGLKKFGQNVWSYIQDPYHTVRALMESPGHRANILKPEYRYIGIGCILRPDGTLYGAQNFGG